MGEYFAEAIKAKEDSLAHHGVLGQKMMEEYGKQKVSEITSNNKSESL